MQLLLTMRCLPCTAAPSFYSQMTLLDVSENPWLCVQTDFASLLYSNASYAFALRLFGTVYGGACTSVGPAEVVQVRLRTPGGKGGGGGG